MNYTIYLRDKSQIEINESDYNNISQFLGKLKLFKLSNGEIVNAADISRIKPIMKQQVILKEFRITEPVEEKRVKVLGGWQKPSVRNGLIRLFSNMREQGHFKGFRDYQSWEKAHYKKITANEV